MWEHLITGLLGVGVLVASLLAVVPPADGDDDEEADGADDAGEGDAADDAGSGDDDAGDSGDDAGGQSGKKTFTQAEVDKITEQRLARERRRHQRELRKAKAATAGSEPEGKSGDGGDADAAELENLRAELANRERALGRERFLRANAGDLPEEYQALVDGEDDEEMADSLEDARQRFAAATQSTAKQLLTSLRALAAGTVTVDELVAQYGDEIKPLLPSENGKGGAPDLGRAGSGVQRASGAGKGGAAGGQEGLSPLARVMDGQSKNARKQAADAAT